MSGMSYSVRQGIPNAAVSAVSPVVCRSRATGSPATANRGFDGVTASISDSLHTEQLAGRARPAVHLGRGAPQGKLRWLMRRLRPPPHDFMRWGDAQAVTTSLAASQASANTVRRTGRFNAKGECKPCRDAAYRGYR